MARWTGASLLAVLGTCTVVGICLSDSSVCRADVKPAPTANAGSAAPQTAQARLEQVKAQIEAGEFGPAIAAARSAKTPEEQISLLQLIVQGQTDSGDVAGGLRTAALFPNAATRVRARANVARQGQAAREPLQFAGGMGGQNWGLIMNLIMENTGGPDVGGPWMELDGEGGTMTPFPTGVRVNPHGLLFRVSQQEQNGQLAALGLKARVAALNDEMANPATLRFVSLTRLERAVAARVKDGVPVLETMRRLAGLSQIQYVFIYPEEKELVIAGPAEGWRYNAQGLPVGTESGRPTLQLDDLVTVLRTFAPGGSGVFGCSINPREEGLRAVKQFVEASEKKGPLAASQTARWLKEIQSRMGLQDIEVFGIPADTRMAQVLVEADYRMKLIGIGKLEGGQEIPSFFELLTQNPQQDAPNLDALRWWLTMKYDAVLHSPDRDVFAIRGSSVLVQSENQLLTAEGKHVPTGKAEATNRLFAKNFTEHYAELAKRDLVFADLQNLFDLGMVAALCQHEHLAQRIGWDLGVFAAAGDYRVARVAAPKTVESVMNHRLYNGKDLVVQVAGGVRADLQAAVSDSSLAKESAEVKAVSARGKLPQLPAARWWWDAAE